ncbi:hypothetical protein DSO57_1018211 [Entomophthora muscae]|uniref:Uncharacterized protein n=1 Tax=Entomophthora muscae TaxID=34485 RepID=A0ACC2RVS5_9FUNG|nr:hypothetical protein DSO57_1018211 [Entomophthora muscae]
MQMFEDIPGHTQNILATSKNVVKSLTCDNLKYSALNLAPLMSPSLTPPMPPLPVVPGVQAQEDGLEAKEHPPKRASWLLGGMILMGLDSYFPRLSSASSLWMPLQAAIPDLYWIVSWWILPPGWEPNSVSLAPLPHKYHVEYLSQKKCLPLYSTNRCPFYWQYKALRPNTSHCGW